MSHVCYQIHRFETASKIETSHLFLMAGLAGIDLSPLSPVDFMATHDLYWASLPFGLHFQPFPPWDVLTSDIDQAIARREDLLTKNPNMIFLVQPQV